MAKSIAKDLGKLDGFLKKEADDLYEMVGFRLLSISC